MPKLWKSRPVVAVLAVIVTAVVLSGVSFAVAANSPTGNTYWACAKNGQIDADSIQVNSQPRCDRHETLVSWDQTGPVGGTGAPGTPGATGGTGLQGGTGPQGLQGGTGPQGLQGGTGPAGTPGGIGGTGPQGGTGVPGGTGGTGPAGPVGGTGPAGSIVGSACTKGAAQGEIAQSVDPTTGAVTFTCVVPTLVLHSVLIDTGWGVLIGSGLQPGSSISVCENAIPGCATEGFVVAADGTVNTAPFGALAACGAPTAEGNQYFTGTTQFGTPITSNVVGTPAC